MTRNTSHTPNLSAIEDRAIAQSERIAEIRTEMRAEAALNTQRFEQAQIQSATNYMTPRHRRSEREIHLTGESNAGCNDQCFGCGVKRSAHREFGCKRWRVG